jgi:hypothetical protein
MLLKEFYSFLQKEVYREQILFSQAIGFLLGIVFSYGVFGVFRCILRPVTIGRIEQDQCTFEQGRCTL